MFSVQHTGDLRPTPTLAYSTKCKIACSNRLEVKFALMQGVTRRGVMIPNNYLPPWLTSLLFSTAKQADANPMPLWQLRRCTAPWAVKPLPQLVGPGRQKRLCKVEWETSLLKTILAVVDVLGHWHILFEQRTMSPCCARVLTSICLRTV